MNGKVLVTPVPPAWSEDSSSSIGVRLEDSHGPDPTHGVKEVWGKDEDGKEDGGYDYTKTTTEVYGVRQMEFFGPYAGTRQGLDYGFHRNYRRQRQEVQDGIIRRALEGGAERRRREWGREGSSLEDLSTGDDGQQQLQQQQQKKDDDENFSSLAHVQRAEPHEIGPDCRLSLPPSLPPSFSSLSSSSSSHHSTPQQWVVFTAGPMGAGKSHTLKWLAKRGFFPLDDFVLADPDVIRNELPEIEGYIERNPLMAGQLTHKEAGYVLEILIREGLKEGRNVLVQGSLRDAAWHAQYFQELRECFPGLRIAIIHVTASRETVLSRARRRGIATRRVVPDEVLLASLEETPRAVGVLERQADYCVAIDNDGRGEPRLVGGCGREGGRGGRREEETWTTFSGVWRGCGLPWRREGGGEGGREGTEEGKE
ncbi:zeta p-loop nucleoside triphosphate hydrolase [Nannochloropsis oceanica]